jgi:hypothetical protein
LMIEPPLLDEGLALLEKSFQEALAESR